MAIRHFRTRASRYPLERVYPVYGRLVWLDQVRIFAIAVMILDHALLFFASQQTWAAVIRLTVTRCAEPLFLFVFSYLISHLGRAMRPQRWLQLICVSMVTSWALSNFLGSAIADVLASIAVVAPLLPLLLKIPRTLCLWGIYFTAALAALPVSFCGVVFDYSPLLIAYQVLLVRLHCEGEVSCVLKHGSLSGLLLVASAAAMASFGAPLSTEVFVVLFGHPLAAVVIRLFSSREDYYSTPLTRVASKPLTIYASHVLLFALVARLQEISG